MIGFSPQRYTIGKIPRNTSVDIDLFDGPDAKGCFDGVKFGYFVDDRSGIFEYYDAHCETIRKEMKWVIFDTPEVVSGGQCPKPSPSLTLTPPI